MKHRDFLSISCFLIFYLILIFTTSCRTANYNRISLKNKKIVKWVNSASYQVKIKQARIKFLTEDYDAAFQIYKRLLPASSQKAFIDFRIAECYFAMKNYNAIIESFKNTKSTKTGMHKDMFLLVGNAYYMLGQLNNATDVLEEYVSATKIHREEYIYALKLIEQCKTAKELISKPINVKIKNLGYLVNSPFEDYGPSVSEDGKILIFTSRRHEAKGIGVDPVDRKYYEDIFISVWNEEANLWSEAESVKGRLNSYFHDAALSISPDGKQIFVYRNIPGKTGSGDIYVSNLSSFGRWSEPKPLPKQINTSYFESSASLSTDGNYIYFVSEKRGGYGNGDIYRSRKISEDVWGKAENLGPLINTPYDEASVFIHSDNKTLFFSSKGHNSMGGYDIFKSTYENGNWSEPQNLGYPINTLQDDLHFVLTANNKTAYYSTSNNEELYDRDIYEIDMCNYPEYALNKSIETNDLPSFENLNTNVLETIEEKVSLNNWQGEEESIVFANITDNYLKFFPESIYYHLSNKEYKLSKEKVNLSLNKSSINRLSIFCLKEGFPKASYQPFLIK